MIAGRGQTLIDVAVERSGSAQEAWTLAVSLGVGLTYKIEGTDAGSGPAVRNKRIVLRYNQEQTHPATELTSRIDQ